MTNGNIFCVTGPLCGEFTGHRLIFHTKATFANWYFQVIESCRVSRNYLQHFMQLNKITEFVDMYL